MNTALLYSLATLQPILLGGVAQGTTILTGGLWPPSQQIRSLIEVRHTAIYFMKIEPMTYRYIKQQAL